MEEGQREGGGQREGEREREGDREREREMEIDRESQDYDSILHTIQISHIIIQKYTCTTTSA